MKQLLTIITLFFTVTSFAQKEKIEIKHDTLIVPLGSCKVIKLGDKYYEVEVNLKEVSAPVLSGSIYYPYFGDHIQLAPGSTPTTSENLKSN